MILLGSFKSQVLGSWWYTIFASSGVIFAAVYLLWMYQRVVFGEIKNQKLTQELTDINKRELVVLLPIILFIVWIGVYPATFLKLTETSAQTILQFVNNNTYDFLK